MTQPKPKKPYQKPRLRVISLAADEVLAIGCKTATGGNASGPPTCTFPPCSKAGS